MQFDYRYLGNSTITSDSGGANMTFVPDASRSKAVAFQGIFKPEHVVRFREAMSALHDVVVNDQRFVPKDRSEYLAWRAAKDQELLALYMAESEALKQEISSTSEQILELDRKIDSLKRSSGSRNAAIRKYYDHLYKVNKDAWWVLDPVITVHDENVFFECFSRDESSYGKLSCDTSLFTDDSLQEKSNGTTNIDYSEALYNEFQKLRDYRTTQLNVDPGGFEVKTQGEDEFREVKIDLPDSWVRGFLQISAAMGQPLDKVRLHPQDVYMMCQVLRKYKDTAGTRAIQFHLAKGKPVKIVMEPWGIEVNCTRSTYYGHEDKVIRVWGRRRLHILERLISIAKHFDLYLGGTGLPYFFVADLEGMQFTLGLSGWSSNNFSEGSNFSLLAPRGDVSNEDKETVFNELGETWVATVEDLMDWTGFDNQTVSSSLMAYIQAGRVVYDLDKKLYQKRELTRDPLNMDQLRFSSPEEEESLRLLQQEAIDDFRTNSVEVERYRKGQLQTVKQYAITATVNDNDELQNSRLVLNENESVSREDCDCTCSIGRNNFKRGLCRHVLALRLELNQRVARGFVL